MLEASFIGIILAKVLVVVVGFGYSVLAILVYRQVVILCKILGTNLAVLLKLLAILHFAVVVLGSVVVFFLI